MKLHEAMRKLVTLRGREVLAKGDLAELLEREHAFDSCPDLRPVIELLVSRGYAGMLLRAGSRGSGPAYSREEGRVRREMARGGVFWQALIDYATDSVACAIGLRSSVLSPFDPGFRYSAGIFYPARLIAAVTGTLVLCSGGVLLEWLSGSPVHGEFALAIPFLAGVLLWLRTKK